MKMIKRVSFGYHNFSNFRNRILLGFNNKRVTVNVQLNGDFAVS
ncbi:hypothetical protein [Brochothrix thermosphacta]|nr:hypothetical protein [Brochothrix thermosphacta]